jgi:glycosyltransferase involved in cell wall biosynthesis
MVKETLRYTNKSITVTPFGVDAEVFRPKTVENIFEKDSIVIGTIKTLEKKYGIDYLIKAFSIVKKKHSGLKLKLLIVGGGSEEESLKQLTRDLNIETDTVFTGKIRYDDVVSYYNMLDIYVAVSVLDSESFGVAVLEASSCEKPVIVSDVGGLPEVVENGVTGIIVKVKDIDNTAAAIEQLIIDEPLRRQYGINGRNRVLKNYNWKENVKHMLSIYDEVLNNKK